MRHARSPHWSLFILTDSNRFVTAVTEEDEVMVEAGRIPLLAPITIHHWIRNTEGWVLAAVWKWDGGALRA